MDLLCMGRAAVDLYAQQMGASLEKATTFAKYVGGCPANIAVGLSRLGLKTGILSGVGDEAMGRFVRETLRSEGVDVTYLFTKPDHLTGLVLLGIDPPDRFPLIFYRENCSDMALTEGDITEEMFQKTKALLITGTHCSNPEIFAVTKKAVLLAREAGCEVILDIDYRPVLWGAARHGEGEERYVAHEVVAKRLGELTLHCSVIVGTEEEIRVAGALPTKSLIVQKRGEQGCIAYQSGREYTGAPFPITVTNVLGAGDAFMSGFLRGYLSGESIERCCELGNANGALVVTRHGCAPAMPYWDELQTFIASRCLAKTEIGHHQLSRKKREGDHFLLAIDHRSYFDQWGDDQTREFKELVTQAFYEVQEENSGLIIDSNVGDFRCIEEPGAVPLEFLNGEEARHILDSWPRDVGVKVLCPLPDAIKPLKRLYTACVSTQRELLIEFVDPSLVKIAQVIELCYQNGICPEWWKLPPHHDLISWRYISKMIDQYDPHCHGILLLGQNHPLKELSKRFGQISANEPKIRGFAVGRTIWGTAAEKFFSGATTGLKEEIAKNFATLIQEYRRVKSHDHAAGTLDQNADSDNSPSPDSLSHAAKGGTS